MALQNPQTDYSVKTAPTIPRYVFSKLYPYATPLTAAQQLVITTEEKELIFELPPRCINLSRSYLSFVATPTAGGNNGAGTPANYVNVLTTDTPAFLRQVDLYTKGGTFLCTINNFDKYANVVLKAETRVEDSVISDITRISPVVSYGEVNGTIYNNIRQTPLTVLDATVVPNIIELNNAERNMYEPIYVKQGAIAGNTATPVLNVAFPLSHIKNSILAMDKDFYFNEAILLRFTFNSYLSWGFKVEAPGGTATTLDGLHGGAVPLAGDITLTQISLMMAVESNQEIASALVATVQSVGLNTVVPFVYQFKNSAGNTTSQNVSIRMNRSHGRKIKKIYHAPFNATETGLTRYNHNNRARDIVTSYYTMINNVRLTDFDIRPTHNEDWLYHYDILKGTIMGSTHDTYLYNWVSINKFDDEILSNKSDTVDSGLPLDVEIKWDFVGTTSASAHNHYTFIIVTRDISINREGIFLQ